MQMQSEVIEWRRRRRSEMCKKEIHLLWMKNFSGKSKTKNTVLKQMETEWNISYTYNFFSSHITTTSCHTTPHQTASDNIIFSTYLMPLLKEVSVVFPFSFVLFLHLVPGNSPFFRNILRPKIVFCFAILLQTAGDSNWWFEEVLFQLD